QRYLVEAQDRAASAGTVAISGTSTGNQATLGWTGTDVRVIASMGPNLGIASITVDGQTTTVDLYSPVPRYQQSIFYQSHLPSGAHQITMSSSGSKAPQSNGRMITLDAIETR